MKNDNTGTLTKSPNENKNAVDNSDTSSSDKSPVVPIKGSYCQQNKDQIGRHANKKSGLRDPGNPNSQKLANNRGPSQSSNNAQIMDTTNEHSANAPVQKPITKIYTKYLALLIVLPLLISAIVYIIKSETPSSCNMNTDENRDFNKYYGITDSQNHFTTTKVYECNASIIFQAALPQKIFNFDRSASSFMALGIYGTGKTLLRCEYFKSLPSNKYLKVSILSQQIDGYLERFVSTMNMTVLDCKTHDCLVKWSENDFAQLLLSILVTEFIDTYDNLRHNKFDLTVDERINLISIICYYYNGPGTGQLENFVNSFINKGWFSKYKAEREKLGQNKYYYGPLFNHLKNDLDKFSILKKDDYTRLHLLSIILENEVFGFQADNKHLYGNTFQDLAQFSLFIKKYFTKTVVFVIDGIDDNKYFYSNNEKQNKKVNKGSLESFCRSSASQPILSMVMGHDFHLSLFYPKIDGVNIEDIIIRKDKFLIHTITWNTKSLINYADYVLQEMNKKAANTRCKAFTDFKTLVNYSNEKTAEIIKKIATPRALHKFISNLIIEMNSDANNVKTPFEATFENIDKAYNT